MLRILHPQLPACADCKRWLYDLKTGRREERLGRPVKRPAGVGTPCRSCPKIPDGAPPCPESAQDLTAENAMCFEHYKQCRATGHWPKDERVMRNASIIRDVEDAIAAARSAAPQRLLSVLGMALGGGRG